MDPTGEHPRTPPSKAGWLAALVFFCAAAASLAFLAREHRRTQTLAAGRDEMSAALAQARSQIDSLSARVDALTAAAPPPLAAKPASASRPSASKPRRRQASLAPTAARSTEEPGWKQLRSQISEQEKQIAAAREEVEKAREDLQGKLDSARDELGGSIARTHEELAALQKRGARTYHEFHIRKSREFQRVGPLSVSLRKINYKRKSCDLNLIVDDVSLQKKGMMLFEPVLISLADRPQPLELVVNRMTKDEVFGYLSEPRFKNTELAAAPAAPAAPLQSRPGPR